MKDDNSLLEMSHEEHHLGKVEIAPEVIEVIAGIAASEVEGVAEMRGNFATGVVERFGKRIMARASKSTCLMTGLRSMYSV